jgi:hypothetical protein
MQLLSDSGWRQLFTPFPDSRYASAMTRIRLAEACRKSGFILALMVSKWQADQH